MYSYSKIKTYEFCQYKFYLKYVKRATASNLEPIEVFTGRTVHKVIEIHSKNQIENTLAALNYKLEETWQQNWHNDITPQEAEEKYKNHAKNCLKNYYDLYKDKTTNEQTQIEQKLFGKIANETMTGIIDRLETGENYYVIDYKTGELPNETHFKDDWQLALYALILTQNTKLPAANIQLQWEYIAIPKTITISKTQTELNELENQIETKLTTIKTAIKTNTYNKNATEKCQKCEYYQVTCDGKPNKTTNTQPITLNSWL